MASLPKPSSGPWDRNKVTVTANVIPSTAAPIYSIRGKALGCSVDATGEVSIGSTAGTITVRVSGTKKNFDEVEITITEYKPPPAPTPDSGEPGPEGTSSGAGDVNPG